MAIPTSGSLSMSQFNTELGRASTTANSQLTGGSTPQVGSLVYIADLTGTINIISPFYFSDWYGYPTPPPRFYDSTSSADTTSITLPTGLRQNDLVIICSMSPSDTQNLPTGYTAGQDGTSNLVRYRWSYKLMGATPDTTASGLSINTVAIAIVFRNINTTTILDVTSPAITTSDRDDANSPSITTATNNSMVVSVAFQRQSATLTAPINFTLARTANRTNGTVAAAYRIIPTAGAEDPGVFGPGTLDSEWVAATFALRPA